MGELRALAPDSESLHRLARGLIMVPATMKTQLCGSPTKILERLVATDYSDFLYSPACEWAYIVNVDTAKFEVYEGCVKQGRGRYRITDEFLALRALANEWRWTSTLLAEFPVFGIPEDWVEVVDAQFLLTQKGVR